MFSISRRRVVLASSLLLIASMVLMPGLAGRRSPATLDGSVASADASDPRSYDEFIVGAYLGALGRFPTCFERQAEFDSLVYATANGNRLAEARRFVSTLFETQSSFDNPDATTYCQTAEYEALNPANCNVFVNNNSGGFITDLYRAFLLREPESNGFNAWMATIPNYGRKVVLNGFRDSTEFSIVVGALFEGERPNCGCLLECPENTVLDSEACVCRPCRDTPDGHFGILCQ